MQTYHYIAQNSQGQKIYGQVRSNNEQEAFLTLLDKGMTSIEFSAPPVVTSRLDTLLNLSVLSILNRPSQKDLMIFANDMALMIDVGIPLADALSICAKTGQNKNLSKAIFKICQELGQGCNIATAFARQGEIFPSVFVSIITVGENSGDLEQSFRSISQYLQSKIDISQRLTAALRYPIFVLIFTVVAFVLSFLYIVPLFVDIFTQTQTSMPPLTALMLQVSLFLQNNIFALIFLCSGLFCGFVYWKNTPQGRLSLSWVILKIPIVGSIVHRIVMTQFCQTLNVLFRSGVPLLKSLKVVSGTLDNAYIAKKIDAMHIGLEAGQSLPTVAQKTRMFSPLVLQIFQIGDNTGDNIKMLSYVAKVYEYEVDTDLKKLPQILEPLTLLVTSSLVMLFVIGVFLPLWDLPKAVLENS